MNSFTYRYPITVYFGEKAAEKNLPAEFSKVDKNVMLAYGGSVIGCCKKFTKDELLTVLNACR